MPVEQVVAMPETITIGGFGAGVFARELTPFSNPSVAQ